MVLGGTFGKSVGILGIDGIKEDFEDKIVGKSRVVITGISLRCSNTTRDLLFFDYLFLDC